MSNSWVSRFLEGVFMANGHGGARPGAGRKKKGESNKNYNCVEFTNKQLQELLASPHVAFVSRRTVTYTAEFKNLFWQRYVDGVDPAQIFYEAGIDPDIIGRNRVQGLAKLLRQQKSKGLPFSDGIEFNQNNVEKKFDFPTPPKRDRFIKPELSPQEVAKMYHKVEYLSQEMEFIKKIILADKDGKSK